MICVLIPFQAYLRESGLGYLFPRVELCLQEPEQDLVHVDTTVIDSKLGLVWMMSHVLYPFWSRLSNQTLSAAQYSDSRAAVEWRRPVMLFSQVHCSPDSSSLCENMTSSHAQKRPL